MNPRDRKPMTRNEMMVLYIAAQKGVCKKGYRVGILKRAMRKLSFQMTDARRKAILAKGRTDARCKRPAKSEFEGRHLGSMESMTYYDGYATIDVTFKNPYRTRY